MKAVELRKSILQMAVQGKLVSQNPQDEPAAELIGRICKEKNHLISEGMIKKERALPLIAEDEVPYDLPDGWVWCRLGDIAIQITSGSREWAKYYSAEGAIFLRMGNLSKNSFRLRLDSVQHVTPPQNAEGNRTKLEPNDILVSITGDVGNLGLIPKDLGEAYINQHTGLVRLPFELQNFYFPNLFLSPLCQEQFNKPQRGIKNSFRLTDLSYMIVPIPPLNEQHRIVNKIDRLMTMCDQLEAAEKELDRLEENFIEYLPKSILQMAVQGKLVPQNLHDEPASELLARIRKKKIQLVKEGKLKKEKPQQSGLEESPYELPEGWIWCRLDEIADFKIGKTPARANDDYWENGIYPWVSIADMRSGEHLSSTKEKISRQAYNEVFKTTMVPKGSLLFSFKLSIGKVAILDMDAFTNEAICSITPFENSELIDYLFRVFPALDLLTDANDAIKGKTLNSKSIAKILIPLPPLAEQQRIVAKVDAFMDLYNELKETRNEPVLYSEENKVLHFLKKEEEEQILMVAQGAPSQKQSEELRQAIDDLFGDDGDE